MSWFPRHEQSRRDLDEIASPHESFEAFDDHVERVGDEIAPGVIVERRTILTLPLALAGTAALGLLAPLAAQALDEQGGAQGTKPKTGGATDSKRRSDTKRDGKTRDGKTRDGKTRDGKTRDGKKRDAKRMSFDSLLDELQPLAEGLVGARDPNEESYLHTVASMLQRLDLDELPRRVRRRPLAIVQLRLKPNAAIPFHDHREYNGVILGLEGEMRIRNYEILGEEPVPPKDTDFRIRETVDASITPGRVSTLARRRDNVHDLRAGEEGGRVLDVFTFFGKAAGSHYMTVDEQPVDAKRRIYSARWRNR